MSFNLNKFQKASFEHREEDVPVPNMAPFFGEGEEPIWRVRSMTHSEISKVRNVDKVDNMIEKAIGALAGDDDQKAEMMHQLLGDTKEVPAATRIKIEMITICSVEPKISKAEAVKLANFFPTEFDHLTEVIGRLTDEGPLIAKKKRVNSGMKG